MMLLLYLQFRFLLFFLEMEKSELFMDVICVLFLLCSRVRSSFMSVVFDFNTSLNDAAPLAPILLSVDLMEIENGELLINDICVFLSSSQLKSIFVIVVFDFNASLNDVTPVSSMLLSVDLTSMKKVDCLCTPFVCIPFLCVKRLILSAVSAVFVFKASLNVFVPPSPMLLTVDLKRIEKSLLLMDAICIVSFVFTFQIELSECCV